MEISSVSSKKKIDEIVETGKKLFYRYGIKKVSVEEICKEAGVSKATFYKYFKNKVDLALFILKEIFDNAWKEYYDIVNSNDPFNMKMEKIIKWKGEMMNIFIQDFIKEFAKSDIDEINRYINQEIHKSYQESKNFYLMGKKEGYIRKDVDLDFLFTLYSKIYDLFTDKELAKKYPTPGSIFEQLIKIIMYGIISNGFKKSD